MIRNKQQPLMVKTLSKAFFFGEEVLKDTTYYLVAAYTRPHSTCLGSIPQKMREMTLVC